MSEIFYGDKMGEIFDEVWCSSCGLIGDAIVIDEDFDSLCENFWGDYTLTIACAHCLREDSASGNHDGIEILFRNDFTILLSLNSDEQQEFLEKVAAFKTKFSPNALDFVGVNTIIRKLCLSEYNLSSAVIKVSLLPMQTDSEVPYLVFKTYQCDRVNSVLKDILYNQEHPNFNFDCQPIVTMEHRGDNTVDAENNKMLFPIIQTLKTSGLDYYEPKFWFNSKGPDGHVSFGIQPTTDALPAIYHLVNHMNRYGLSVTTEQAELEVIKRGFVLDHIDFDSSIYYQTRSDNDIEDEEESELPF
jgi:hypothetical protein